jgi:entry exclusion lipoprotein TrbK
MNVFTKVFVVLIIVLSASCSNAATFKEPTSYEEWKIFCTAPDFEKRLNAIEDREQRQKAAKVCFRAPWIKFKKSAPVSW